MTMGEAKNIRRKIEKASSTMPDEDALDALELFPKWIYPYEYRRGERIRYGETLYKVLQDHTSQEYWTPDIAISLYVRVDNPADEWPEWLQPLGAHDAYPRGAKVAHNGDHWVSDIDANVYEPGSYGWSKVV